MDVALIKKPTSKTAIRLNPHPLFGSKPIMLAKSPEKKALKPMSMANQMIHL
jgi:hypothetical protein